MENIKNSLVALGAVQGTGYTLSYLESGYLKPHYPDDSSGPCVRLQGSVLEIQHGVIHDNTYSGVRTAWKAV